MDMKSRLVQYLREAAPGTLAGLFYKRYPLNVDHLSERETEYVAVFLAALQRLNEDKDNLVSHRELKNESEIIYKYFYRFHTTGNRSADITEIRLSDLIGSLPDSVRGSDEEIVTPDEVCLAIEWNFLCLGIMHGSTDWFSLGFKAFVETYYEVLEKIEPCRENAAIECMDALRTVEMGLNKVRQVEGESDLPFGTKEKDPNRWRFYFKPIFYKNASLRKKFRIQLFDRVPAVKTSDESEEIEPETGFPWMDETPATKRAGASLRTGFEENQVLKVMEARESALQAADCAESMTNFLEGAFRCARQVRKDVVKKHYDAFLSFVENHPVLVAKAENFLSKTDAKNHHELFELSSGEHYFFPKPSTMHKIHELHFQKYDHGEACVQILIQRSRTYFFQDYIKFQYLQGWHAIVQQLANGLKVPTYSKGSEVYNWTEPVSWFPNFGMDLFQLPDRKALQSFLYNLYRTRVGVIKFLKENRPSRTQINEGLNSSFFESDDEYEA